jgi:hypothetical protein
MSLLFIVLKTNFGTGLGFGFRFTMDLNLLFTLARAIAAGGVRKLAKDEQRKFSRNIERHHKHQNLQ